MFNSIATTREMLRIVKAIGPAMTEQEANGILLELNGVIQRLIREAEDGE